MRLILENIKLPNGTLGVNDLDDLSAQDLKQLTSEVYKVASLINELAECEKKTFALVKKANDCNVGYSSGTFLFRNIKRNITVMDNWK